MRMKIRENYQSAHVQDLSYLAGQKRMANFVTVLRAFDTSIDLAKFVTFKKKTFIV